MSPEQADGKPTDERSDIYSLGCLMYEVLTGEQPFTAGNVPAVMLAQINRPAPKLVDKFPDMIFPVELEELIAKCLAKKKEDRFQNVIELRNAVAAVDEQLRATNAIYQSGAIGLSGVYNKTGGFLRADNAQINAAKFRRLPTKVLVGIASVAVLVLSGFFAFTLKTADIFKPGAESALDARSDFSTNNGTFSVPNGLGSVEKRQAKKPTRAKPGDVDDWTTLGPRGTDKRLYELLGLKQIDYLNLSDSDITDKGVLSLASEPIVGLRLENTQITDKALAGLNQMKQLEELSLKGCKNITDEGLKKIVGLRTFEFIDISDTNLSDKAFLYLGGCKQLRTVVANNCKNISGVGFPYLNSTMINTLELRNSGIKCTNLVNLRNTPMLATIDLADNNLVDQDLDYTNNLNFCCSIDLSKNPRITNDGFLKLLKMQFVHTVKILECKGITKLGVSKFMAERSGTIIVWDQN
jgi:Serine/threonine protein kinase